MIQSISEWTKTSDIQWESNPAWYSLNTTPESNHQGPNHKIYTTINTQAYHFIQKLPNLAITLRKI